jgi:hypothetical protein
MHPAGRLLVLGLTAALVFARPALGGEPEFLYQDLPPAAAHMASAEQIYTAIVDNDVRGQRAHTWGLWAALTAPSVARYRGQSLAIWQTWFSTDETFSETARTDRPTLLDACCTFEEPAQDLAAHAAFGGRPERVLAMVRYNADAHGFIVGNAYNRRTTRRHHLHGSFRHAAAHRPQRCRRSPEICQRDLDGRRLGARRHQRVYAGARRLAHADRDARHDARDR